MNKLKYYVFVMLLYLFILQNPLQRTSILRYLDEIVALLSIPALLYYLINKKRKFVFRKNNLSFFMFQVTLIVVGLYSSYTLKYQPINIVFSDLLLVNKFFMAYIFSRLFFYDDFIDNFRDKIYIHVKVIVIALLILTIFNYVFAIWPASYRFSIMTNKLFYEHPTYLASICIFLISLLFLIADKNISRYNFLFLILILILISTFRFKAIGACLFIVYLAKNIKKNFKKISISKITIIGFLLVLLCWDQISYYYIDLNSSARNVLTETSFKIAKDYFPLGTGFGTYGSYFSGVSYSPVYYMYNISHVYGISKNYSSFLSDTFWPMVLGQFGIIGLFCFIMLLKNIFSRIQNSFDIHNVHIYISKMICFIYLLISSTSESAYVNSLSIPLAIIIGIKYNKIGADTNEKKLN